MIRCDHAELEGCLEVRLLEAGVHAARVGRFELRVEVSLIVDRVDETMKTLAGVHVGAVGRDDDRVRRLKIRKRDARPGDNRGDIELDAIEHN